MKVSAKEYIRQRVIKNLLQALEGAVDRGEVKDSMRLSRFLLKLSKKMGNKLIQIRPEECEQGPGYPPDQS